MDTADGLVAAWFGGTAEGHPNVGHARAAATDRSTDRTEWRLSDHPLVAYGLRRAAAFCNPDVRNR